MAHLPGSRCFVAMLQGEPVGAYVVQCIAPAVHELMGIVVSPEYQSRGIGSKLLNHAELIYENGIHLKDMLRLVVNF